MDKNDLKIEFRAVPHLSSEGEVLFRSLQYRLSPNQDLYYYKYHSLFWGLIKFRWRHKYSTDWIDVRVFHDWEKSYRYDLYNDLNYTSIFIDLQSELDHYKNAYKTYGEFMKYLDSINNPRMNNYMEKRISYLKSREIMY